MEEKGASGNTAAENTATSSPPSKKTSKSNAKVQRSKSTHPSTAEMVTTAIKELKDRKGSSVQAIKKYIATTYKVDGEKFAPFIKRYLRAAVTSGAVVQTKGKGASGSFKLPTIKTNKKKTKKKAMPAKKPKPVAEKVMAERKSSKKAATEKSAETEKTVEKKSATPKKTAAKTAAAKKVEAAAKQKAAAQTKNLSKTKKATKAPAAKTKTPKPKTTKAAATKSAKTKK